jgi:hypothetical protein
MRHGQGNRNAKVQSLGKSHAHILGYVNRNGTGDNHAHRSWEWFHITVTFFSITCIEKQCLARLTKIMIWQGMAK